MKTMIRIITMVMSISCMLFINGVTSYAESRNIPFYDENGNYTYPETVADLVYNMSVWLHNESPVNNLGDIHSTIYNWVDGETVIDYMYLEDDTPLQLHLQLICCQTGSGTDKMELAYHYADGREYYTNCLNLIATYEDGSADRYRIVADTLQISYGQDYISIYLTGNMRAFKNINTVIDVSGLTSCTYRVNTKSVADNKADLSYQLRYSYDKRLLGFYDGRDSTYHKRPTDRQFVIGMANWVYKRYADEKPPLSVNYSENFPNLVCNFASTNDERDNPNIYNYENYSYLSSFAYNSYSPITYSYNDFNTIKQDTYNTYNNYFNEKYPDRINNNTVSDDFKEWGEDDILFTIPKLEIPTETLPTSVLEDGATIVNYGVGLLNTIDERLIIILLVLGVVGIIWSITGA